MENDGLSIGVADVNGIVTVTVGGDLDIVSTSSLERALGAIRADGHVVLDCSDVTFMDSTGLRVLIVQSQRLDHSGGSLRMASASRPVQTLLRISGVDALVS